MSLKGLQQATPRALEQGRVRALAAGLALGQVCSRIDMKATSSIIPQAFSASILSHYRDPAPCQGPWTLTLFPGLPVLHPCAPDLLSLSPG